MASTLHHLSIPALNGVNGPERATAGAAVFEDVDQQRLRILRCTARAMASTPGGLSFSPGARPWLDGLTQGHPGGGRDGAVPPATND